ncbi:MAG: hypothetical protein L0Y58_02440 [Verrucomicrobia subdivision 3 bacterium]|nr:hypothetical protein [Limisphaerales bacterium]
MRARDNPFRSERVEGLRYRPQGYSWDELWRRLEWLGYRCAIVGPEGSGKTTLLENLGEQLTREGRTVRWLRLNREQRSVPRDFSFDPGEIILADGIEQLGAVKWHLFVRRARRAGGLIITIHTRGRLPTLLECTTSPELLRELVSELVDDEPILSADALYQKHSGNLRHAMGELYELYAERETIGWSY